MAAREEIQQLHGNSPNSLQSLCPKPIYPERQQIGSDAWYEQQWRLQWQQLERALQRTITSVKAQAVAIAAGETYQEYRALLQHDPDVNAYMKRLLHCLQAHPGYGPAWVDCLNASAQQAQGSGKARADQERGSLLTPLVIIDLLKLYGKFTTAAHHAAASAELLSHLNTFAAALFDFFLAGFYPPPAQSGTEEPSTLSQYLASIAKQRTFLSEKYPPNFVLRALLGQITHDLSLFRLIVEQRCRIDDSDDTITTDDTLLFADTLGQLALQAATNAGLLESRYQTVIAYRDHRVEVRLLPYHATVLLGMPLTTSVLPKAAAPTTTGEDEEQRLIDEISGLLPSRPALDYLAIPHEIGHVVYRFGQQTLPEGTIRLQQLIRNRLRAQPYRLATDDWRFAWLEELFADAYGCVVAGPISALGFQMMLADGLPPHHHQERHQQEASNYPAPVLRPLIQSEILRHICDQQLNPIYPAAPDLLDQRWHSWVSTNWPSWVEGQWTGNAEQHSFILDATYQLNGAAMSGKEILTALQPVIAVLLQVLDQVRPQSEAATWSPDWDQSLFLDEEKLTGLYERFCDFAQSAGLRMIFGDVVNTATEDVAGEATQPDGAIMALLQQQQGKQSRKGGIDSLIELLLFAGWSEEGPANLGHGGGG